MGVPPAAASSYSVAVSLKNLTSESITLPIERITEVGDTGKTETIDVFDVSPDAQAYFSALQSHELSVRNIINVWNALSGVVCMNGYPRDGLGAWNNEGIICWGPFYKASNGNYLGIESRRLASVSNIQRDDNFPSRYYGGMFSGNLQIGAQLADDGIGRGFGSIGRLGHRGVSTPQVKNLPSPNQNQQPRKYRNRVAPWIMFVLSFLTCIVGGAIQFAAYMSFNKKRRILGAALLASGATIGFAGAYSVPFQWWGLL
jgi:hypothetical protein